MHIVTLQVFVAVAEHDTMSAAAAAVGYARSTVSEQLHGLERDVGVPLMRGNPMRLTPAGRTFLAHARIILAATELGVQAARHRHDERPRDPRALPAQGRPPGRARADVG